MVWWHVGSSGTYGERWLSIFPRFCPDVVVGMSKEWDNLESVLKEAGDLAPVAVDWWPSGALTWLSVHDLRTTTSGPTVFIV